MTEHFRLIEGKELYQIDRDPGQKSDIAEKHPEQVAKMRAFYEAWWAELEPTFAQTTEIVLGHADHPVVSLTGHDWIQKGLPPWNQRHIRSGHANKSKKHEGHWAVKVVTEGNYQISMRRWPQESQQPITAALAAGANVPGATKAFRAVEGKAVMATRATLRLNEKDLEMKPVTQSDQEISFTTKLKVGSHKLAPVFHTKEGELGAYYTIVTKLE